MGWRGREIEENNSTVSRFAERTLGSIRRWRGGGEKAAYADANCPGLCVALVFGERRLFVMSK